MGGEPFRSGWVSRAVAWSLGLLGLGVVLLLTGPGWLGTAPATCVPHCFCEAVRPGVAQGANAWSSLVFVPVGAAIAAHAARAARPFLRRGDGVAYGAFVVLTGLGSALLHGSLTLAGQFVDVLGMYLIAAFLVAEALGWLAPVSRGLQVGVFVVLVAAPGVALLVVPQWRRTVFAVTLVAGALLQILAVRPASGRYRWLLAGLVSFGVAFVLWQLDENRVWCDPTSLLQGHAAWHMLDAAALAKAYLAWGDRRETQGDRAFKAGW